MESLIRIGIVAALIVGVGVFGHRPWWQGVVYMAVLSAVAAGMIEHYGYTVEDIFPVR